MKRILTILTFTSILLTSGCELVDPTPECEKENVGTVKVKNSTGESLWVDVTWGSVSENYEKLLYRGDSYKYFDVPAGSIEIWASFNGDDWSFENESLSACEDMEYTWRLTRKKSTSDGLALEIKKNGVVITTITEFQKITR